VRVAFRRRILPALVVCLAALSAQGAPTTQFPAARLRVDGRAFCWTDGRRFDWRGLTSFRLLDMVADGRSDDAVAVLDWAAANGITVVRVLSMADVLFQLSPAEGRASLGRLLDLAGERRLVVEIVALADTARLQSDLAEQVAAVGAACAAHANCVLELANEPWARQTQRQEVGDAARLTALRRLVPPSLPVSLGSAPADDSSDYAGGDYITVHVSRDEGEDGWRSVSRLRAAWDIGVRTGKPVVDDEPSGAAGQSEPGRRDADPGRWFARGALARMLGLGATFHFEGGLQSQVPAGREAACFEAWRKGLDALPADVAERVGRTVRWGRASGLVSFDPADVAEVAVAQAGRDAWAIGLATTSTPEASVRWRDGWHARTAVTVGRTLVASAHRE
jgi:hypothetical protein